MRTIKIFLLIIFALVSFLLVTTQALAGGKPFQTHLSGAEEVPGPGDSNGTGEAYITLNFGQREICFTLKASDITLPATAAHIHIGARGDFGPPIVHLTPPDSTGNSMGCVTVDQDVIRNIRGESHEYYINIHTTDFPDGAIRGQL